MLPRANTDFISRTEGLRRALNDMFDPRRYLGEGILVEIYIPEAAA